MEPDYSSVLSPLDQLMPRTYTRVYIVFALNNHGAAVEALRLGLAGVYSKLPFLKGFVYSKPESKNQLSIAWSNNDPDPEFSEILAPDTLTFAALVKDGAALHHFHSSLCPVTVAPDHSTRDSKPAVFAASYSQIDGGLILALGVHHFVMDGTGVGELIRVIAECTCSGKNVIGLNLDPFEPLTRTAKLRNFAHSRLADKQLSSQGDVLQRHPEFTTPTTLPVQEPLTVVPAVPKGTSKIFRFPVARILAAKKILSELVSSESLTTNTILTSLIWSVITRIRFSRLKPTAGTRPKLGFAINGRKHLGDDFLNGAPYFGNVNLFGLAIIDFADIKAASECQAILGSASAQGDDLSSLLPVTTAISKAVARISPSHVSEVIQLVEDLPDVTKIAPGWNSRNGPDLTLTSWANMGVYECNFGDSLGQPEFVRIPYAEFDGLVIVLPRRRSEEEKIEAVVMLCEEDMAAIESDDVWKSWTTNI
jgi:hypothetical protein